MSYIKKVWVDDTTPVSALNMNHIEQGIVDHEAIIATDILKGHIKSATQAEVFAGIKSDAAVTTATLEKMWVLTAIPSETERGSLPTQIYVNSYNVWVKKKQFTIPHNGIYRVKFNMRIHGSAYEAHGMIYKNGYPYGTERAEGEAADTTYTEDLAFNEGDTCEIWAMETDSSANGMYLNWASIHYDASIIAYRELYPHLLGTTGQDY